METKRQRTYSLLNTSVMTFSGTQVLLFSLFPIISEKLSLSLSSVIAAFAIGTALFLIGAPFWSSRSETLGPHKVLSVGLLGLSISSILILSEILFPTCFSLSILILSRIIYGLTASAIVPIAQILRSEDSNHSEQMKNMLSHSFALSIGRMIGPLIVFVGLLNIPLMLAGISLWTLTLSILSFTQSNKKHIPSPTEKSPWSEISKAIFLPLLVTIISTTYTGILHSSLGGTIQKVFHLKAIEATSLMAQLLLLGSAVMAIIQILAKRVLGNRFGLALVLGLGFLSVGATALAFMNNILALWVAIALICAGLALIQPGHLALVHMKHSGKNLASKIGILSSGNTIGYALGGMITSFFIQEDIQKISLIIVAILCAAIYQNFKGARV